VIITIQYDYHHESWDVRADEASSLETLRSVEFPSIEGSVALRHLGREMYLVESWGGGEGALDRNTFHVIDNRNQAVEIFKAAISEFIDADILMPDERAEAERILTKEPPT
jgi:hypothetical protein